MNQKTKSTPIKKAVASASWACLMGASLSAHAMTELGIAIDVSTSIGSDVFEEHREVYKEVLSNPVVMPTDGSVAVSVAAFDSSVHSTFDSLVITPETLPDLLTAIDDIAYTGGGTNILSSIEYLADHIGNSGIDSTRRVIDVSTDGVDNNATQESVQLLVDQFEIDQVNCLGIGAAANCSFIAGEGAFAELSASDKDALARALATKLVTELEGIDRSVATVLVNPELDDTSRELTRLFGSSNTESVIDAFTRIGALTDVDQAGFLSQLMPRSASAIMNVTRSMQRAQASVIDSRLLNIRNTQKPVSIAQSLESTYADSIYLAVNEADPRETVGYPQDDQSRGLGMPMQPWGFFISNNFISNDASSNSDLPGFNTSGNLLSFGTDYRMNADVVYGAILSLGTADSALDGRSSNQDYDATQIALFATYDLTKQYYLDGTLSLGIHDYDSERSIMLGATNQQFNSSGKGKLWSAAVTTGTQMDYRGWLINPYARLQWVHTSVEGSTENNPDFALTVNPYHAASTKTFLGAQAYNTFNIAYGVLAPAVDISWSKEFDDKFRDYNVSAADATNSDFVTMSYKAQTDNAIQLGATLDWILPENRNVYLRLESFLEEEEEQYTNVTLGFRASL